MAWFRAILIEAVQLWVAMAVVVVVASVIHYFLESRDLKELQDHIKEQKAKPQPRDM